MPETLKRASIRTIEPAGDPFDVLFNPNQYRLSKSNQFSEFSTPGGGAPLLQFGHGSAQTLTLQLFFDTYDRQARIARKQNEESVQDVSVHVRKVTDLLKINEKLHAPPICQFSWGGFVFVGVMQQANVNFTLFLPNGVPVRATADVVFKQFFDGKTETGLFSAAVTKKQSANFNKRRTVRLGDTLSMIAAQEYEDATLWRKIADANHLDDPLAIRPGDVLIIPAIE
ncbi:MAG: LysM peptidoglycan-binding domain-containing protein [Caldilineaceae bacterium]|nr:LysM peptidoglycan-binding domain-containing protein [Caldilineaceae bacterium]